MPSANQKMQTKKLVKDLIRPILVLLWSGTSGPKYPHKGMF